MMYSLSGAWVSRVCVCVFSDVIDLTGDSDDDEYWRHRRFVDIWFIGCYWSPAPAIELFDFVRLCDHTPAQYRMFDCA